MKIILIGFMGSGKSSVGLLVSSFMSLPYFDTDLLVMNRFGAKTNKEIFESRGELAFREAELSSAKELSSQESCVIATGGGIVLNKIALDYLRQGKSKVFFLHASFQKLTRRLQDQNDRPLFDKGERGQALYSFRYPLYEAYADEMIDTNPLSANQVAMIITRKAHGF